MTKASVTLSNQERLLEIESELPNLVLRAQCEADRIVATGDGGPFSGAMRRRDELQAEQRDLQAILRDERRRQIETEIDQLDKALSLAMSQRTQADATVKTMMENELIHKWLNAPRIARDHGVGYSFEQCRSWLISGQTRAHAPQAAVCLNDPNWPQALTFTPSEREAIRAFESAKEQAARALLQWSSVTERRAQLLNMHPEFKKAS